MPQQALTAPGAPLSGPGAPPLAVLRPPYVRQEDGAYVAHVRDHEIAGPTLAGEAHLAHVLGPGMVVRLLDDTGAVSSVIEVCVGDGGEPCLLYTPVRSVH